MASSQNPSVLYLGASRGIGFSAYITLATARREVHSVLLLRSVERFKESPEGKSIPSDILSRTTFVKGDALEINTVLEALKAAGDNVEAIVSSIGHPPPNTISEALSGMRARFRFDPPDLCCRAMLVLIDAINRTFAGRPKPKLIVVTSMGMGKKAHVVLPFGLGIMYTLLLENPFADKIGMELVVDRAIANTPTTSLPRFFPDASETRPHVLTASALEASPAALLSHKDVCVVRPALLTNGERKGEYRAFQEGPGKEESSGKCLYSISRKDAGDFVARLLIDKDGEGANRWWGHQPVIGY